MRLIYTDFFLIKTEKNQCKSVASLQSVVKKNQCKSLKSVQSVVKVALQIIIKKCT
jgi:hypothetical protein